MRTPKDPLFDSLGATKFSPIAAATDKNPNSPASPSERFGSCCKAAKKPLINKKMKYSVLQSLQHPLQHLQHPLQHPLQRNSGGKQCFLMRTISKF